jgi:drug/metabolite transporter (DMT)-like permease
LNKRPILYILLSAALFGLSSPLSKILVRDISPVALAGLLYLGAFVGLAVYSLFSRVANRQTKVLPLEKKDWRWLFGAIVAGGITAPISMMLGLQMISGFSASLFLNLEGITTVVIAVIFFQENAGKRLWLAIACVTVAGVFLFWNNERGGFSIAGPLLVTLACVGWGIDNNMTRQISDKDPIAIGMLKGLIAGTVSLIAALIIGNKVAFDKSFWLALGLGALSYGLSLVLFIKALKGLGSSRTGVFFSFGPFIGAAASIIILREWLGWVTFPALALMVSGVWLIIGDGMPTHMNTRQSSIIIYTGMMIRIMNMSTLRSLNYTPTHMLTQHHCVLRTIGPIPNTGILISTALLILH